MYQRGHIYAASGAFYVRWTTGTEIVDGKPRRIQTSHRLCFKDDKHYAKNAASVKLLADAFMLKVNQKAGEPRRNERDLSIVSFWEETYLPFIKQEMRPATVYGYSQIWEQHLKAHFGTMTLREYRPRLGSQFLTELKRKYGRRTLAHIRSLASGIFTHAINLDLIESNPWHDVKILGKVRAPSETAHYTLEEIEDIISALVERVDSQLIIALAFFLGLRPSEIAGLQWGDVSAEYLHIRRALVRDVIGPTKTELTRNLELIQPVKGLLVLWHQKCPQFPNNWMFPNQLGRPMNLRDHYRRIIRPVLRAKGLSWKGLYAGRRGCGTALVGLTNGNYAAAQETLGHKHMSTTLQFYKKRTLHAQRDGLKALEASYQTKEEGS
jgi:integrase